LVTRSPHIKPGEQGNRSGDLDQSRHELAKNKQQEPEYEHDGRDDNEAAHRRQGPTLRRNDLRLGLFDLGSVELGSLDAGLVGDGTHRDRGSSCETLVALYFIASSRSDGCSWRTSRLEFRSLREPALFGMGTAATALTAESGGPSRRNKGRAAAGTDHLDSGHASSVTLSRYEDGDVQSRRLLNLSC
jgi:hypothetical protein